MDVNDNACSLDKRGVVKFFASKLAPTRAPAAASQRLLYFLK